MSFIIDLIGSAILPGGGGRKRERQRAEMWERRDFPAGQLVERFGTWSAGTGHAEPGVLTFEAAPSARGRYEIAELVVGSNGPAMFGQTVRLEITTQSGAHVTIAVLADYAEAIVGILRQPIQTDPHIAETH